MSSRLASARCCDATRRAWWNPVWAGTSRTPPWTMPRAPPRWLSPRRCSPRWPPPGAPPASAAARSARAAAARGEEAAPGRGGGGSFVFGLFGETTAAGPSRVGVHPAVGAAFADENAAPPGPRRAAPVAFGSATRSATRSANDRVATPSVADPATSALARAMARAGVIRHCLAAAQRCELSDVILPTAAAAARLAATRGAALGVLLRLAQLPGGARALCESGAMAALAACRAVDAYAHDSPGDAAAAAAALARARAPRRRARAAPASMRPRRTRE